MAASPDITSMALFCDFENVALGVRDTHHEKFDIKLVLEKLLLKGSIVVKKAYCDWDRYKGFKATMHEANFELIEIPHVRQSGKNSADIRLVVDALDLCYTKAHVNTFVIISGDSDFSPLVSKLRENNKQVIGVGVKQSTSDLLIANCDEFIFYDDLVREGQRTTTRREARPAAPPSRRSNAASANPEDERKREEAESRRSKAVELALQTFEALYAERGDGGKIWASVLKEAIKRRKPDFSESYYGFRSFGGLLEEMQARGFLEMGRDEKSNAYVFRSMSGALGTPAVAAAQESAPGVVAAAPAAPEILPVVHRAGESESRAGRRTGQRTEQRTEQRPDKRERGGGTRSRGGRRGAPERHEFQPTLEVDRMPAPARQTGGAGMGGADTETETDTDTDTDIEMDTDDAAERFADAARESQAARRTSVPADEPTPGPDTDVTPAAAIAAVRSAALGPAGDELAPATPKKSSRRRSAARKTAAGADESDAAEAARAAGSADARPAPQAALQPPSEPAPQAAAEARAGRVPRKSARQTAGKTAPKTAAKTPQKPPRKPDPA